MRKIAKYFGIGAGAIYILGGLYYLVTNFSLSGNILNALLGLVSPVPSSISIWYLLLPGLIVVVAAQLSLKHFVASALLQLLTGIISISLSFVYLFFPFGLGGLLMIISGILTLVLTIPSLAQQHNPDL
jgi:hypothetical protein